MTTHYEYMTLIPDLDKPFNVVLHKLLVPIKCKTISNEFGFKFKHLNYILYGNSIPNIILDEWEQHRIEFILDKFLMQKIYRGTKTLHTIPIHLN